MLNIKRVLKSLSEIRPIFHSEADLQHSLAWEIREHYPDCKIRLETKIYGANTKVYLDILCVYNGRKYAIELKYKTISFNYEVDGEEYFLNNQGAQDIGRYDVLKDLQRLEEMVSTGVADEGLLIFLTNDKSYHLATNQDKITVDRNFRIHEGKRIGGQPFWEEQTGKGTMKSREKPITLQGKYKLNWDIYSQIGDSFRSDFRYLMLTVNNMKSLGVNTSETIEDTLPKSKENCTERNQHSGSEISASWFYSFSEKGEIPTSQRDLRDKIANHLRHIGYSVQINREIDKNKIDIWAEKDGDEIAIEVRYKTALLQTIYRGNHLHLKNQAAQDISRYDFISDLGKIERIVKSRPSVNGYALLLTNDHLYWQPPKKQNSVDEAFHIHDGHVVTGLCSWKKEASKGTTSGREEPVSFTKSYVLNWQPYLKLEEKKNEQFQALLVEVNHGEKVI